MARDRDYVQYQRKDGKPGRWIEVYGPEYTRLNTCFLCGFTSTLKKVSERSDCWGWWWERVRQKWGKYAYPEPPFEGADNGCMLCTGCWNKARAIKRKEEKAEELNELRKQLERTIRDARRNHAG